MSWERDKESGLYTRNRMPNRSGWYWRRNSAAASVEFTYASTKSIDLNGTNQYIDFGYQSDLDIAQGDAVTVFVRQKLSSDATWKGLLGNSWAAPLEGWNIGIHPSHWAQSSYFSDNGDSFAFYARVRTKTNPLTTDAWASYSHSKDTTELTPGHIHYNNAVLLPDSDQINTWNDNAAPSLASAADFYIGVQDSKTLASYYKGRISEFWVWVGREMSAAEMTSIHNSGTPFDLRTTYGTNLVLGLVMGDHPNDVSGTSVYDFVGDRTGTLINSPAFVVDSP